MRNNLSLWSLVANHPLDMSELQDKSKTQKGGWELEPRQSRGKRDKKDLMQRSGCGRLADSQDSLNQMPVYQDGSQAVAIQTNIYNVSV